MDSVKRFELDATSHCVERTYAVTVQPEGRLSSTHMSSWMIRRMAFVNEGA